MNEHFYRYMCKVVGSEQVVRRRRLFLKILNHVMNGHKSFHIIISGSKGEGLDMPGSDVDIMIIIKDCLVQFLSDDINTCNIVIADTDNASPGFAVLRMQVPSDSKFGEFCEYSVLSNIEFKQFCNLHILRSPTFAPHGPCLSSPFNDFDYAYCLKSDQWPTIAYPWVHRYRESDWPTSDLANDIAGKGVIFVPIGSKDAGSTTDNPLEWRISFSEAEKMLIHSFNHTQVLCYALFKIVVKEFPGQDIHLKHLLCSYHIKTIMFWVMEAVRTAEWTPGQLFKCFRLCLKRLIYYIQYGFCPHYFIQQYNLFEGKFTDGTRRGLLDILYCLYYNGDAVIFQCKSLTGFLTINKSFLSYKTERNDDFADRAVFSLLYLVRHVVIGSETNKRLDELFKHIKSKLGKQMVATVFANLCCCKIYTLGHMLRHCRNNKSAYSRSRYLQAVALMGASTGISGWLLLAVQLRQNSHFKGSLDVLNHVLSECTSEKSVSCPSGKILFCTTQFNQLGISLLQKQKLSFVFNIMFFMPDTLCAGSAIEHSGSYMSPLSRLLGDFPIAGKLPWTGIWDAPGSLYLITYFARMLRLASMIHLSRDFRKRHECQPEWSSFSYVIELINFLLDNPECTRHCKKKS